MKKYLLLLALLGLFSCGEIPNTPVKNNAGVKQATATVSVNANGRTVEQENIINRLKQDNKPGAIKHLYIMSAYSGQVLIYSTVKGKVTSSGKRLNPYTVAAGEGATTYNGIHINIDGTEYMTGEVLQDDGTYGSSVEYIYWWDSKDVYHQQYITGGMIVHISDQPLSVKSVVINLEETR